MTSKNEKPAIDLPEGSEDSKKMNLFAKMALARKVHSSLQLNKFKPTPPNIAEKMGLTLNEVQSSLSFLEELNVIQWENSIPKVTSERVSFLTTAQKRTKQERLADNRIFTHQFLNDLSHKDRYVFFNGTLAADDDVFWELNKKIEDLQEWFIEAAKNSKKTKVMGYSFTAGTVSKPEG